MRRTTQRVEHVMPGLQIIGESTWADFCKLCELLFADGTFGIIEVDHEFYSLKSGIIRVEKWHYSG